jgi:hypothetical protein
MVSGRPSVFCLHCCMPAIRASRVLSAGDHSTTGTETQTTTCRLYPHGFQPAVRYIIVEVDCFCREALIHQLTCYALHLEKVEQHPRQEILCHHTPSPQNEPCATLSASILPCLAPGGFLYRETHAFGKNARTTSVSTNIVGHTNGCLRTQRTQRTTYRRTDTGL